MNFVMIKGDLALRSMILSRKKFDNAYFEYFEFKIEDNLAEIFKIELDLVKISLEYSDEIKKSRDFTLYEAFACIDFYKTGAIEEEGLALYLSNNGFKVLKNDLLLLLSRLDTDRDKIVNYDDFKELFYIESRNQEDIAFNHKNSRTKSTNPEANIESPLKSFAKVYSKNSTLSSTGKHRAQSSYEHNSLFSASTALNLLRSQSSYEHNSLSSASTALNFENGRNFQSQQGTMFYNQGKDQYLQSNHVLDYKIKINTSTNNLSCASPKRHDINYYNPNTTTTFNKSNCNRNFAALSKDTEDFYQRKYQREHILSSLDSFRQQNCYLLPFDTSKLSQANKDTYTYISPKRYTKHSDLTEKESNLIEQIPIFNNNQYILNDKGDNYDSISINLSNNAKNNQCINIINNPDNANTSINKGSLNSESRIKDINGNIDNFNTNQEVKSQTRNENNDNNSNLLSLNSKNLNNEINTSLSNNLNLSKTNFFAGGDNSSGIAEFQEKFALFISDILTMYNKLEHIRETLNIDKGIYLDDLYKFFDNNNDKEINIKEFHDKMAEMGVPVTYDELKLIFKRYDLEQNLSIR